MQDRGYNSFASNLIKLSVNETKWSSLLARIRALILYISIWIFDFGPEKLSGLSRNERHALTVSYIVTQFARESFGISCFRGSCMREYDLILIGLHVKMLDSAPFTVRPWKNTTCLRGHLAQ